MSSWLRRLRRNLTEDSAETARGSEDPRLTGRTYAVPFEEVWQVALGLATSGLKGWRVVEADDLDGVIRARCRAWWQRREATVTIRIGLDADGQTRVDARATYREGRHPDLGANARRLNRFMRRLDRALVRHRREQSRPAPVRIA